MFIWSCLGLSWFIPVCKTVWLPGDLCLTCFSWGSVNVFWGCLTKWGSHHTRYVISVSSVKTSCCATSKWSMYLWGEHTCNSVEKENISIMIFPQNNSDHWWQRLIPLPFILRKMINFSTLRNTGSVNIPEKMDRHRFLAEMYY